MLPTAVEPLLVDDRTACKMLGLCTRTLFKLRKAGRLAYHVPVPGRVMYDPADIEAFKKSSRVPQPVGGQA
jgi:Helix-turn-helix domain